jgi:hypothetical protein
MLIKSDWNSTLALWDIYLTMIYWRQIPRLIVKDVQLEKKEEEMARPISIAVRGLKCIHEQESSDEPYVITSVVDLRKSITFAGQTVIFPSINTVRTGPLASEY